MRLLFLTMMIASLTLGCVGADGENGAPGADGENGAPGADGEDGNPGVDGEDGAPGADGENGAPGADGEDFAIAANPLLCQSLVDSFVTEMTALGWAGAATISGNADC